MRNLLRLRDFRLLFIGRSVDELGDAVSPAALALAIVAATRSADALALLLASELLPRLALLPLGGAVADRMRPRLVALASDLVQGAAQLLVGAQLLSGSLALAPLAAAAAIGGAASAFGLPTTSPLVAGTVEEDLRQAANSLLGVVASATRLAGPAIAGALIFTVGPGWAFVLDSATFAVSASTLALLRVRPVQAARQSIRRDLVAGWAHVRSRTWYWTSLLGHATWNFAAGMLATLGPLIAVTQLGGRGVWLAAVQASAVGYLAGSLLAGRTRVRRAVLVGNLALTSFALPLALFAAAAPAAATVVAYGLAMGCLGFMNPIWETAVQQQIPAEALARVSAYDWLVSLGAMPLGYALGPILAGPLGPGWPLAGAAVLVLIATSAPGLVPEVRDLCLRAAGEAASADPAAART